MAGRTSRSGRGIDRRALNDDAVEGIKRNATGSVQHQQVTKHTGTDMTSITGTKTTKTTASRAFASNVKAIFTTAGTATAGTVFVKRGGTAVTSATATTSATISTTGTFTSAPATWTVGASNVAGGTVNINTYTISREDTRG